MRTKLVCQVYLYLETEGKINLLVNFIQGFVTQSKLSLIFIKTILFSHLETGVPRKQSTSNFTKNEHFLLPYTQGVRNARFFENSACFVFLKHLF